MENKKIVFSAMQPSGKLTLANYIGTLRYWKGMQKIYQCIYSVADLHAITNSDNKNNLHNNVLDILAFYLSVGVDPNKSIIFVQSNIPEHCQLYWILNCNTTYGELIRMNQFKSRIKNSNTKKISAGILNYPILMASDILLYNTNMVLIGSDQKQHIELTKKIAIRFNFLCKKNILKIPNYWIPTFGSKIMSLANPMEKMSKSDKKKYGTIFLSDSKDVVFRKIGKSITDSDQSSSIYYDKENKPGISNLLEICSILSNISISNLEKKFLGYSYKNFKIYIAEIVSSCLCKLQQKYQYYRKNEKLLLEISKEGTRKARLISKNTIKFVHKNFF
ncbi:tryptophan--tRNA ligase [Buchnera aphidicola (Kurisakia onigurumii)]|uniref:tryptophan--tRNA ligase n=1 Tax=Buchnera aphidicola TaxID=9 RepID=UPI0031B69625